MNDGKRVAPAGIRFALERKRRALAACELAAAELEAASEHVDALLRELREHDSMTATDSAETRRKQ